MWITLPMEKIYAKKYETIKSILRLGSAIYLKLFYTEQLNEYVINIRGYKDLQRMGAYLVSRISVLFQFFAPFNEN